MHLAWSSKGEYLASADADRCVALFKVGTFELCCFMILFKHCVMNDVRLSSYLLPSFQAQRGNFEEPWLFVGRNRAHFKPIRSILFGINVDTDAPRLLSVGEVSFFSEKSILFNFSSESI